MIEEITNKFGTKLKLIQNSCKLQFYSHKLSKNNIFHIIIHFKLYIYIYIYLFIYLYYKFKILNNIIHFTLLLNLKNKILNHKIENPKLPHM